MTLLILGPLFLVAEPSTTKTDHLLQQIAEKPELEKWLTQGLKVQAQLTARQEAFETDTKKEDETIKGLEDNLEKIKTEITARWQVRKYLIQEYEAETALMKMDADYCDDPAIRDMTAQLESLTSTMESFRTALNK